MRSEQESSNVDEDIFSQQGFPSRLTEYSVSIIFQHTSETRENAFLFYGFTCINLHAKE